MPIKKDGLAGLDKNYSHEKLIPHLSEYLAKSPRDFGWGEDVWSVKVLMAQFKRKNRFAISRYTVIRALYEDGFTAKRAKKTTPTHAPSKEEKHQRVQEIASEISELRCNGDFEVMFLDESHFTTDPYVVRGRSKRGQPFSLPTPKKRESCTIFGAYAPENDVFTGRVLLKAGTRSSGHIFISFGHMRQGKHWR